ncbi:MAG: ATP-binding protein [Bradymonadales bacterium]|nr:ATP-binding protein [Bradymonadales bacterium]
MATTPKDSRPQRQSSRRGKTSTPPRDPPYPPTPSSLLEARLPPTQISPEKLLETIENALKDLGLMEMWTALQAELAIARPDDTRLEWLWRIVEPQLRFRLENRVDRRIKDARLPARKTLQGFDFAFQVSLDRDLIMELATLRFIGEGRNILFAGMSGTGKSHLGMALCMLACVANRRVLYTTSADMLSRLNASLADDTLHLALRPYRNVELLMIDEVGLEQVERSTAIRSGLMQKVLLHRHNKRLSTVITSNIPWDAWGDYLDDQLGAAAILDRLIQHSHIIVINGPSYREWLHKQEVAARSEQRPEGR